MVEPAKGVLERRVKNSAIGRAGSADVGGGCGAGVWRGGGGQMLDGSREEKRWATCRSEGDMVLVRGGWRSVVDEGVGRVDVGRVEGGAVFVEGGRQFSLDEGGFGIDIGRFVGETVSVRDGGESSFDIGGETCLGTGRSEGVQILLRAGRRSTVDGGEDETGGWDNISGLRHVRDREDFGITCVGTGSGPMVDSGRSQRLSG